MVPIVFHPPGTRAKQRLYCSRLHTYRFIVSQRSNKMNNYTQKNICKNPQKRLQVQTCAHKKKKWWENVTTIPKMHFGKNHPSNERNIGSTLPKHCWWIQQPCPQILFSLFLFFFKCIYITIVSEAHGYVNGNLTYSQGLFVISTTEKNIWLQSGWMIHF